MGVKNKFTLKRTKYQEYLDLREKDETAENYTVRHSIKLYFSLNFIRVIKLRMMPWVGHVVHMWEVR
jgi:hypothetical protein